MVSCMMLFREPIWVMRSMNPARVFPPTNAVRPTIIGNTMRLARASQTLRLNIITRIPTSVMELLISVVTFDAMALPMASTSFVSRLIRSPAILLSKKLRLRVWMCSKSSFLSFFRLLWLIIAMTQPEAMETRALNRYTPTRSREILKSLSTSPTNIAVSITTPMR